MLKATEEAGQSGHQRAFDMSGDKTFQGGANLCAQGVPHLCVVGFFFQRRFNLDHCVTNNLRMSALRLK